MTYVVRQSPMTRLLRGLGRVLGDRVRLLSLLEQAVLSGSNFLAILMLARGLSEEVFGTFSFAYISLLFMVNLHRSAVVVPFVIHTAPPQVLAAEGRLWRRLNLWSILVGCGLVGAGLAVAGPFLPPWMGEAGLYLLLFLPLALSYEFIRRWAIQINDYGRVVLAAVAYASLMLGGAVVAVVRHDVLWAVGGYAAGNLVAAGFCLPALRTGGGGKPDTSFGQFLSGLAHFAGWSTASNLAYNAYYHLPPLILGVLAGPGPVGAYQALRNFTQPLFTLGTAVDNFDKPRAARAMAEEGLPGMRRQLGRTTTALFAMALPYCLLLAVFAPEALSLVYGDRYAGQVDVLWAWVLFGVVVMAVYPFETGLFLVRRADVLFRGRLVSALLGVGLAAAAIPHLGVLGAMLGLLSGTALSGFFAAYYLKKVT